MHKVSPAFEGFFTEGRPEDRQEALVVYRVPQAAAVRPATEGRVSSPKKLQYLRRLEKAQAPVQEKILRHYERSGGRALRTRPGRSGRVATEDVGGRGLPVAAVQLTRKTLPALAEHPDVVAILPNQRIHLIRPKEVSYEELRAQEKKDRVTWGLTELGIPELWERTRGRGVRVAVLDTGVEADHPALRGRVKKFVLVDPRGRRIKSPVFDCGTHGTHVCGIVAGGNPDGIAIGVAPEARLLVAAVLVGDATVQTLLEGIGWAIEAGADIINMSLGFAYYEPLFAEIFKVLIDQYGILPVVAIGNENHGNTSSPGNAYNALAVGAIERGRGRALQVPSFSSGASLVFPNQTGAQKLVTKPDVVAPGVQVYSCIPAEKKADGVYDYSYMDGTSMATPHTSGVIALLMAAKPKAPLSAIMSAVMQTAEHPSGTNAYRPDNRWGYGVLRPMEALKAL
jgi:subtilisin family serine protease